MFVCSSFARGEATETSCVELLVSTTECSARGFPQRSN